MKMDARESCREIRPGTRCLRKSGDVESSRIGRHVQCQELRNGLKGKRALRIPRSAMKDAKVEYIRAALRRASSRNKLQLATSAAAANFCVWGRD